jgi:hypothetical protein
VLTAAVGNAHEKSPHHKRGLFRGMLASLPLDSDSNIQRFKKKSTLWPHFFYNIMASHLQARLRLALNRGLFKQKSLRGGRRLLQKRGEKSR